MKKNKLIKGNAKRVIAVASAFMMTCSTTVGTPLNGATIAYAKEAEVVEETGSQPSKEDVVADAGDDMLDTGKQTDESRDTEESESADESEPTEESEEESGAADESEATDESGTEDESEAADETEETDEGGTEDESEAADETEVTDEGGTEDESEAVDKSEVTDESGTGGKSETVDESEAVKELEEAKKLDDAQAVNSDLWYVELGSYMEINGHYYVVNEETEEKTMLTGKYIEVERGDKIPVIYVDEDGKMVKHRWLEDDDGHFRFVNGEGEVIRNKEGKVAGKFYGDFDDMGYWTPVPNTFFEDGWAGDTPIIKYSLKNGALAGENQDGTQMYYCFLGDEKGMHCYLMTDDDGADRTQVSDRWIGDDLWINSEGYLTVNLENQLIDGKYYDFDGEGHCSLVIDSFIRDENGEILCYLGEDGEKVTSQFVSDGDRTYYFGKDGTLERRQWIEDEEGRFRYVNDEGRMIVNKTKAISDFYGTFDADGYWTPNEYEYFESELSDVLTVKKYAGKDGRIAGIGEKDTGQHYCFEFVDAETIHCRLLSSDKTAITDTPVSNTWISDDMRADGEGNLIMNVEGIQIEGSFYNFDENGRSELITSSFIQEGDDLYYVDEDGTKVVDQKEYQIEEKYYNFDENGLCDPIKNDFIHNTDGTIKHYVGSDGTVVTNMKEQNIKDKYYNSDEDGLVKLITDSFIHSEDGSILCYVGADGMKVADVKEQLVGDKYYTIDKDGTATLITNAFIHGEDGKIAYYVDADGTKVTGQTEYQIKDKYYSFDSAGNIKLIANAFIHDENGEILYYTNADGVKVTGVDQQPVGDEYYKIDSEGHCELITGSFIKGEDGKNRYYVDEDGKKVMDKQEYQIDDKYYNFDEYGVVTLIINGFIHDAVGKILCYVDETGTKVTSKTEYGIENKYYNIDTAGNVTLIVNAIIHDAEGGILYYVDEGGTVVTDEFVTVDEHTLYFGEDGKQVFRQWLQVGDKFRFVNSKGYVVMNETKAAGGYYGRFDEEGYWTAIEYTFINSELDSGETVTMYAGEAGEIAGRGKKENRQHYCFIKVEDGTTHCRLLSAAGDSMTDEPVVSMWIDDLWIDAAGKLSTGMEDQNIGDKYYDFDESGHSTLITNSLIFADGKIVCYVDEAGNKVTNRFVTVGSHILYFGADGAQVFRQWLEVGDQFRFVDSKGYVVMNETKAAGGYYGHFDGEGYWTAIEHTFFNSKLDSGETITKYAGKGGEIAGIGKKESSRHYCFVKGEDGTVHCRLLTPGGESLSDDPVLNVWIDDMWANKDGYLVMDADAPVDGVYYRFDKNGHGTIITYEVSYMLNGGTNSGNNPLHYTGAMDTIVLEMPSRAGYTFDGWYTDGRFTNKITEIVSRSYGNITLYAKWIRIYEGNDNDNDSTTTDTTTGTTTDTTTTVTPSVKVTIGEDQKVTLQTGETTVSAATTQTAEGSVSGNTIVSTTETASVTVAEGQVANVATVAVSSDGSARALLASQLLGAAVQQQTITVQGVAVTQNVVVYADGTQVTQKSGAAELEGFTEAVTSTEKAIQSGSQTLAAAYNDKVSIDLQQYKQVGAAVTYAVISGINGAVPQVQMEQTSFAPGQEVAALITDVNGNVTAVTIIVGPNGIIQYQIPGVNCIVRLMSRI